MQDGQDCFSSYILVQNPQPGDNGGDDAEHDSFSERLV